MTDMNTAPAEAAGAEPVATTVESVLAERRASREPPKEAAPAPAEPAAAETPSGDQPETTEAGAETPAGSEPVEPQEPATPAVQAPQYWSKEAKAEFAKLPPELQAVVADQEKGREGATGKAKQEAAEARKAADTEAGAYRTQAARLGELLPQLEAAVKGKWDGVDEQVWAEIARADPDKYVVLKAEHEADQAKLTRARDEAAAADVAAHGEHVKELADKLPTVDPEFAGKDGLRRVQAAIGHLSERGIRPEQLKWATPEMFGIALDALRYREGLKAIETAPKTEPKPATPALKPAAAAPAGSNTQQRLASLDAKAARTGSYDDVLAARKARREAQKG